MSNGIPATIFLVLIIMSMSYFSYNKNVNIKILTEKVLTQEKNILELKAGNSKLKKRVNYLENTLRSTRVVTATVTAYSPRPNETDADPFITASMQPVKEGTIAVSRDLFYAGWVFGRRVYIEGEGILVITDLMHQRKTQQVDIFMFSTKKALKFGRQQRRVALLD